MSTKRFKSKLANPLDVLSLPVRIQSAALLSSKDFSVEQMYALSYRLDGYGIIDKKYVDPLQMVKEREYSLQQKGQKNVRYVTKRGNYLDDLKKLTDGVPASNKYHTQMVYPMPVLSKSKSRSPQRMTYIDAIYKEQKLRAIPGAGAYNLGKTLKQQQAENDELKLKKIKYTDRPNFLCESEYLGNLYPGPGYYNPREVQSKITKTRKKPQQFIKQHQEEDKKRERYLYPDIGTYQPEAAHYLSFGKMLKQKEDKKANEMSLNSSSDWARGSRFQDPTKSKSKLNIINPGPGQYPLITHWNGKNNGSEERNWMDSISKGRAFSIYNS